MAEVCVQFNSINPGPGVAGRGRELSVDVACRGGQINFTT